MKKIFVLAVFAVMAVSCFKGSYYESSFATVSNFEYADAAKYFTDSVFVKSDFQSGSYLLYSKAALTSSIKPSGILLPALM